MFEIIDEHRHFANHQSGLIALECLIGAGAVDACNLTLDDQNGPIAWRTAGAYRVAGLKHYAFGVSCNFRDLKRCQSAEQIRARQLTG